MKVGPTATGIRGCTDAPLNMSSAAAAAVAAAIYQQHLHNAAVAAAP